MQDRKACMVIKMQKIIIRNNGPVKDFTMEIDFYACIYYNHKHKSQ